ncbi:MAG: 50S ribosomal protein L25 [Actinomycetota bacterium]|nr:50S ribosomal protein L25 [Actinomycetota bacterium]
MEVNLKAQTRSGIGKGPARRARAEGNVPAVLYGSTIEPTVLTVDAKQVQAALHTEAGANVLISLEVDSKDRYLTLAREIQRHPVRGNLIHIDFVNIARDVKVHADVPIHIVGESRGVKEGGQLDHHMHELKVEALPTDVPPSIEIDITDIGIGDAIHVSDITPPSGVEFISEPEEMILAVIEATLMKVETEEAAEAAPAEGAAAGGETPETETSE